MISARKPTNEPERLNALREYEVLETEPEAAFDAMTRVAATLCRVPIALVSLIDPIANGSNPSAALTA